MEKVSWLITDGNITVNYDGETHIIKRVDALADRLIEAIKSEDWEAIPNLVSASKRVEAYSNGNFLVKDGLVYVNGVAASQVLSDKIVRFSNEGLPFKPLLKFAENLQSNPSFRAVNELYQFLEKNLHPLTDNGCFIAYKKVRKDFKDAYSGKFDNSVGNVVEMPRNQVNEDANQTCSHGLHVANWDYAHNVYSAGDGGIMLEVEVNPIDVVAVPIDYNNAKMRVCKYKVLSVITQAHDDDVSLRITENDKEYFCDTCEEDSCDGSCEDFCGDCSQSDCFGECYKDEDENDDDMI